MHDDSATLIGIAAVRQDQFPSWLALRQAVYTGIDRAFHEQEMRQIFAARDKTCLIATNAAGTVCGFVELSLRNVVDACLTSPVGYVEGIYVAPTARGAGVARQLMSAAEDWCRAHGCREVATDAELDNLAAQQFHRSMGFSETYRIVEFRKDL